MYHFPTNVVVADAVRGNSGRRLSSRNFPKGSLTQAGVLKCRVATRILEITLGVRYLQLASNSLVFSRAWGRVSHSLGVLTVLLLRKPTHRVCAVRGLR